MVNMKKCTWRLKLPQGYTHFGNRIELNGTSLKSTIELVCLLLKALYGLKLARPTIMVFKAFNYTTQCELHSSQIWLLYVYTKKGSNHYCGTNLCWWSTNLWGWWRSNRLLKRYTCQIFSHERLRSYQILLRIGGWSNYNRFLYFPAKVYQRSSCKIWSSACQNSEITSWFSS